VKNPNHRARAVRSSQRRDTKSTAPSTSGPVVRVTQDDVNRLATTCASLAHGFAVLSRNLGDPRSVERSLAIASVHAELAEMVGSVAAIMGFVTPRTKSTCGERLRWEWLASSARLTDGASDKRLLDECARLQQDAAILAVAMDSAAPPTAATAATGTTAKRALRQIRAALGRTRIAATKLVQPNHQPVQMRPAFAHA